MAGFVPVLFGEVLDRLVFYGHLCSCKRFFQKTREKVSEQQLVHNESVPDLLVRWMGSVLTPIQALKMSFVTTARR